MQFQVPQFIEVENKIFGPLTFRQFIYLAGGAGLSFLIYRSFSIFVSIPLIIPVAALTLALAYYKINGKPFIEVMEAAFGYAVKSKLYLWKKEPPKAQEAVKVAEAPVVAPKLSESRLKELAWSLDVNEKLSRKQ